VPLPIDDYVDDDSKKLASALVELAKQHKCSTFGLAAVDDIMCVAM
jgi:hypothetical protein